MQPPLEIQFVEVSAEPPLQTVDFYVVVIYIYISKRKPRYFQYQEASYPRHPLLNATSSTH